MLSNSQTKVFKSTLAVASIKNGNGNTFVCLFDHSFVHSLDSLFYLFILHLQQRDLEEIISIKSKQPLSKVHGSSFNMCTVPSAHCACSIGFVFDEHFVLTDQISALSKCANSALLIFMSILLISKGTFL